MIYDKTTCDNMFSKVKFLSRMIKGYEDGMEKQQEKSKSSDRGVDFMVFRGHKPYTKDDILEVLFCKEAGEYVRNGNISKAMAAYVMFFHELAGEKSDDAWVVKGLDMWGEQKRI